MERQQYSQFALSVAKAGLISQIKDNGVNWIIDFFKKSTGQLLHDNIYDFYAPYILKKKMARRYGKRRRVSRRSSRRRYGRRRFRRGGRRYSRSTRGLYRRLRNKGIFSTEVKYRDDELLGYRVQRVNSTLFPCITFTNLSEGVTYQERIGAKLFIRKIKLYLQFGAGDAGSLPQDETYIRWALVRDKVPDTSSNPPFITEPFDFFYPNPVDFNQATAGMCMFRHVNNRFAKRFQYIWGGMTKVSVNSAAGYERTIIKKIVKINKPVQYGVGDDLSDIGPGQLYFYVWSDQYGPNEQNSVYPYMNCYYRVSFTDT